MSIKDWSTTATGNASVAGINFAEGQAPSTVNNSARELMAQVRTEYDPERWGWVAHSATASANVSTQTRVSVAANITADAVANRKVKLTGGSTTVYANIVTSSFTSETQIVLENVTGSLSASHSIVWLSSVYDKNLPGNVVTGTDTSTLSAAVVLGSASFSASVHFTGPVDVKGAMSVSGKASFKTSVSFSGTAAFQSPALFGESVSFSASVHHGGFVTMTGGGAVTSATLSVSAGLLTVGGQPVTGGGGSTRLYDTSGSPYSGSWSAYAVLEVECVIVASGAQAKISAGARAQIYTDGGTTPVLTHFLEVQASSSGNAKGRFVVKIEGNGTNTLIVSALGTPVQVNGAVECNAVVAETTITTSSGAFYVDTIRFSTTASSRALVGTP